MLSISIYLLLYLCMQANCKLLLTDAQLLFCQRGKYTDTLYLWEGKGGILFLKCPLLYWGSCDRNSNKNLVL